mgnify:CR=1 FL=1
MRDYKDTERVDRRIKEMIKQNVVFVENKAGSLKRVTGILADNGINIYGFVMLRCTGVCNLPYDLQRSG